jgi:SAM-dependent methyltransferase
MVVCDCRFTSIHAIDISPTIIHIMTEKYADYDGVTFSVMDVRELNGLPSSKFSVVIDKACIDAVFCSTNFLNDSRQAFKEIYRVLTDGGVFISFSHAPANCRVPFLRAAQWGIDVSPASHGEGIFMYLLTRTDDESLLNKKVEGAESAVQVSVSHAVTSLDQPLVKSSQTRNKQNAGFVTVTASVDVLTDMVNESEDVDS